jgi:dihydrofolate reductase
MAHRIECADSNQESRIMPGDTGLTAQPVTVDVFLSVDGWAGSANSPGYFGYPGAELQQWIDAELENPQVVLLGRRTYEILAALPAEAIDESTRRMLATETIVFSRTLAAVDWPNARICRDDAVGHVEHLKTVAHAPLRTMGSLSIARQLLTAGLVDRLRLMTFPLLAGPDGREPFFVDMPCADLGLIDHRVLDGRILLAEYAPTGRDIPRA